MKRQFERLHLKCIFVTRGRFQFRRLIRFLKLVPIFTSMMFCFTETAWAEVVSVGAGQTIVLTFDFQATAGFSSEPDVIRTIFIATGPRVSVAASEKLFNGSTLFGTADASGTGGIGGSFKSATSTLPAGGPVTPIIDFSSIINRSIVGRAEITITSGVFQFDNAFLASPAPLIEVESCPKPFNPGASCTTVGRATVRSVRVQSQQPCNSIIEVPLVKQFLSPWGTDAYDSFGTIGKYGCLLTSGVMIINYHAASQGSTFTTNPRPLNAWLIANNGYDAAGGVYPDAIAKYGRDNGIQIYYQGRVDSRNDTVLDSYICRGQPIILKVSKPGVSSHFVVATGQTAASSKNTYFINDPGFSFTTLEGYGFNYLGIRKYSSSSTALGGLYITLHSPAELIAMDSTGRRTGQDASGATYGEIPNASYGRDDISDDEDLTNGAPTPEVKSLEILTPASGTYTVNVSGTASGSYALEFRSVDNAGTPNVVKLNGFTIPGAVTSYEVAYSPTPGTGLSVARRVPSIADIIRHVNTALSDGLISNAGVANSLIQQLNAADAAFGSGDAGTARNVLAAFSNHVSALSGKQIDRFAAQLLIEDTQSLRLKR